MKFFFISTLFLSVCIFSFEIQLPWKCYGCRAAVEVLKFLYERNATSDTMIQAAMYICNHFGARDSTICQGIMSQFRDQFVYVLEQLAFQPHQICGLLISDCGDPYNPFDSHWTIPLPPKPRHLRHRSYADAPNDVLTYRVLQLSDLHFDMYYKPGAEAKCSKPVCCQDFPKYGSIRQPAGYWGTSAACDIPYWTIENMLKNINETEKLDYVLLSGDYMSHVDWSYSRDDHLRTIRNLTGLLDNYFPNTPIFWAIGNHEGVPVNSFGPHYVPKQFRPQWIYKALYEVDQKWIPLSEKDVILYRGSYSIQLTQKLKLISLNTGYCDKTNFFVYINQTDPDGTLKWLVDELFESEKNSEYVHIMAHIPPGDGECLEGWARNYYRIVNRFESTISAQFFGHVHADGFTVFYENMDDYSSRPTSMLYVSPSVTTYENLNPAYRIYTIEGMHEKSQYRVIDTETYFFNLSKASAEIEPKWELLYRAKEEYNLKDLSPNSWNDLIEKIYNNEILFNRFLRNYARRDDYYCNGDCRKEVLCSLRRGHHNSTLCDSEYMPKFSAKKSMRISAKISKKDRRKLKNKNIKPMDEIEFLDYQRRAALEKRIKKVEKFFEHV